MSGTAPSGWQPDTSDADMNELANANLAAGKVDDRPALELDPGDAGPLQEDEEPVAADEHLGEGDDDE